MLAVECFFERHNLNNPKIMKVITLATIIASAWARCNNDCSGNGICNAGSVCECELNFLGNDCSDRLCLYGKAFIDSPLGDVNSNGRIDTDQQIQYQYSNGLVGEQYDTAYGLAREDNKAAWNEARFYRECSNKGICDRSTGQCACFPGFEGEGCRRITCPNSCSGHGQCVNMAVSNTDYGAWDEKKTVECQCDLGYTGADCSLRKCPLGSDPIATVYINDNSVYKIQWKQQTDQIWGAKNSKGEPYEHPNGQVHWTMSYKDDFGDIWTTSAVTTYYQARTAGGSLKIGPSDKTSKLVCTPFFMDPDFQGKDTPVVNVDGGAKGSAANKGTSVPAVYAQEDSAKTIKFSFHDSFIGEQVNASIQALPNDVVRYSYVHTVFNYGADPDNVFIYPSMGVPKFKTEIGAAKTLKAATPSATVAYATGSGHCSPDSDILDATASKCANTNKFNKGKSHAVNDNKYRFPYWLSPDDDTTKGIDAVAKGYTKCDKDALCIFITIPEPEGKKNLKVNYKFKTTIRTAAAAEATLKPSDYTTSYAREIANVAGGANALVTVKQVGGERFWHKLIDGTPIISYNAKQPLHDCSRRGLCDFETGKCKCFDGYSGYKCQERSVLGY